MLLPLPTAALSCVTYIHNKTGAPLVDAVYYANFPRALMAVGTIAIFKYRSGVSHVALVEELAATGFWISECNYHPGVCGWRFVKYDDYALQGFWKPATPYRAAPQLAESPPPDDPSTAPRVFASLYDL